VIIFNTLEKENVPIPSGRLLFLVETGEGRNLSEITFYFLINNVKKDFFPDEHIVYLVPP